MDGTAVPVYSNGADSGGGPRIAGPYMNPEHTESIPLKKSADRETCGGSLRIIVICFFVLTLAITIALAAQIHMGDYQLVPHGSVATDSHECSIIGTDILKKGGNAVDAAVASTFCMGVVNPHITGIGGGGSLIIYDHRKRSVLDVIDFREVSPMQVGSGASEAGLDVGVPGVVKGLSLAHQMRGQLPWIDVVMPAVHLARIGFQVPQTLVTARSKLALSTGPGKEKLHQFLDPLEPGKYLVSNQLAAALELIATLGPDVLYNGTLAGQILTTVSAAGGFMTQQDLTDYIPKSQRALISTFGGYQIIVPDLPSGGPLLIEMLNLLNATQDMNNPVQTLAVLQQIIVAHADNWGGANLNGTEQNNADLSWKIPEAVGSHVAAIDSNDIYVSVVSGLNGLFGSGLLTDAGFILNNALANFGSGVNAEGPSKRPLSLATPVIAIQANSICGRRLVLGAGDFSVAAQTLTHLANKQNISNSVEATRFRITSQPMTFGYEYWHGTKISNATIDGLQGLGYKIPALTEPYQSCNLVEQIGDDLSSHSDSRGHGLASRF